MYVCMYFSLALSLSLSLSIYLSIYLSIFLSIYLYLYLPPTLLALLLSHPPSPSAGGIQSRTRRGPPRAPPVKRTAWILD